MLKYARAERLWQMTHARHERPKPIEIYVAWGPSGYGKSWWAFNEFEHNDDYYRFTPTDGGGQVWWDGYQGQKTLVLDNFEHGFIPYRLLLNCLDNYPQTLWVKGGSVQAAWTTVLITSIFAPNEWYRGRMDNTELMRRLATGFICEFKTPRQGYINSQK